MAGSPVEEEATVKVELWLNDLRIETAGNEEEAVERLEAVWKMEVNGEGGGEGRV